MPLDPRTPVLVGVGTVQQRLEDPREALEALELMHRAVERAGQDAGPRGLLQQLDAVRVPRGFWPYANPAAALAERAGGASARTIVAEIGVLQQTLLSDACREIAEGRENVSVVVGGEARYRDLRAKIEGLELGRPTETSGAPDEVLAPREPLMHELEVKRGLVMPVRAFAMIDNALRYAERQSLSAHRDEIAELWSGFSRIAAENPHAWSREPLSVPEIRDASPANRMIAFPYTKRLNSEWNVDQAAALLFCSLEKARALGVPEDRLVFPLSGAESNHVVPLSTRAELHRSAGASIAGRCALERAARTPETIDLLDIYSCFPAAVRVFVRELGLDRTRPLTVTGGMASGGGPLNNYVLQATARMAECLRTARGSAGVVTSVSGFLNKVGASVWSTEPLPDRASAFADVSAEVAAIEQPRAVAAEPEGPARVVSYTVSYQGAEPAEALVICDLPDGQRTLASGKRPALLAEMVESEFCGREVELAPGGLLV